MCSSNRGKAERGWVSWSGWERVGDRGRCGTQKEMEEKLRDGDGGSQRQEEIRSYGALCTSGWGEDFLEFIQRAIRSF